MKLKTYLISPHAVLNWLCSTRLSSKLSKYSSCNWEVEHSEISYDSYVTTNLAAKRCMREAASEIVKALQKRVEYKVVFLQGIHQDLHLSLHRRKNFEWRQSSPAYHQLSIIPQQSQSPSWWQWLNVPEKTWSLTADTDGHKPLHRRSSTYWFSKVVFCCRYTPLLAFSLTPSPPFHSVFAPACCSLWRASECSRERSWDRGHRLAQYTQWLPAEVLKHCKLQHQIGLEGDNKMMDDLLALTFKLLTKSVRAKVSLKKCSNRNFNTFGPSLKEEEVLSSTCSG